MSEDKKDNSRRKVLKVAAGAGLVAGTGANWENNKWTKPVVESVLLPAHAQTSGVANGRFAGDTTVNMAALQQIEPSGFDTLVPTAHAQPPGIPSELCIEIENNQVNVSALVNGFEIWEGTGALDTVLNLAVLKSSKNECDLENVALKVSVKGTEPNRAAFGEMSLDYGCRETPPLDSYSGAYEIMETGASCVPFEATKSPLIKCECEILEEKKVPILPGSETK